MRQTTNTFNLRARYTAIYAFTACISGCAFLGKPQPPITAQMAPTPKQPAPITVADKRFSQDSLYALLVAEMAINRSQFDVALNNYTQQVNTIDDIEVTRRAARVAFSLNKYDQALTLARKWEALAPYSIEAKQTLTETLVQQNKLEDAFIYAKTLLALNEQVDFEAIAARTSPATPELTRKLEKQYRQLLPSYPDNTSILVGLSLLLEQQQQYQPALDFANKAQTLEPKNIKATYQQARLHQLLENNELAVAKMGDLVQLAPYNPALRLRYAKLLAKQGNLDAAHAQYSVLLSQQPNNNEILLALAIIEEKQQNYKSAASHFKQLIDRKQQTSIAHYSLANIYLKQDNTAQALVHYKQVSAGDYYLAAIYQASQLISQIDSIPQAITYIERTIDNSPEKYLDALYLRKGNLLADAKKIHQAQSAFSKALSFSPDNTQVLYSRAMMHLGNNNLLKAEHDFKRIISLRPNHAAALNAYGYSLADQTDRVNEAYSLIARAYELEPNNPLIIDSLGWVEFKRGNIDTAVTLLTRALSLINDPEIVAHLSRALWAKGDKQTARLLANKALNDHPNNVLLRNLIQFFSAQ